MCALFCHLPLLFARLGDSAHIDERVLRSVSETSMTLCQTFSKSVPAPASRKAWPWKVWMNPVHGVGVTYQRIEPYLCLLADC